MSRGPQGPDEWVAALGMQPHPEGGYFRETYRASEEIAGAALPERYAGQARSFSTAILFLLPPGEFSALHELRSDEVWHYHAGPGLTVFVLTPAGERRELRLGTDVAAGEVLQAVVRQGEVFGAAPTDRQGGWALVGCTVAPGFDFADFRMPGRAELSQRFPGESALVERLTRA